jgi:hypothetical protein
MSAERHMRELSEFLGLPTEDKPDTGSTLYQIAREKYGDRFDDERWTELLRDGDRLYVPLVGGGLGTIILTQAMQSREAH